MRKKDLRVHKTPKRRNGGVLDPSEIAPVPDAAEFAKKHGSPDPMELEKSKTLKLHKLIVRIKAFPQPS